MLLSTDPAALTLDRPHTLDTDDVLRRLESTADGLGTDETQRRLNLIGPNRLPDPRKANPVVRFLRHFNDVLIYVLLGAAAVTALLGYWIDTAVILGVVVINTIIGFVQEGKAEQALAGIRQMLSAAAHVRRDGAWQDITAEEVVPGDIVRLRAGDRVPADVRLLQANGLRVEESALTGESVPTDKDTAAAADDAGIGDRHGMAFSGTLVAGGSGIGVVTATGAATEIGRINTMISEVEEIATPLTRQMNQFGKVLSLVIVVMAVLLYGIGWVAHDYTTGELFLAAISFAVAAIPEGLPAILTITLARGVQLMARRNAITRRLNAVETLGSVTVICSDKTGTLTKNEMTVREVVTPAGRYRVAGTGYEPVGDITRDGDAVAAAEHPDLTALVQVMALANDTHLVRREGRWSIAGEPTEGALTVLAEKAGFDRAGFERVAEAPFDSQHKFMATLHDRPDGRRVVLLKGAPDRLLDRCVAQGTGSRETERLDRHRWEREIDELSAAGLRVLAAAVRDGTDLETIDVGGLGEDFTFLGVVGIVDPPRPEAIEAILSCQAAGIRVVMITGDHAGTAMAIGREMGIGDGSTVVTGTGIEGASDEELQALAQDCDIFARTSPEHKLRLVTALQARGDVVSMTGDGVNDAPALKRADVGVAMGIKGTEATKEAAEIVLADDNFSSIERAVRQGRTIYDNLRKAIVFTLPTNGAESLVVLAAILAGLTLPLTPLQILWVNMVTAVTLALALAFEPAEPGIMSRPPRAPGRPILDRLFLGQILGVSVLIGGATLAVFFLELGVGIDVDSARTVAVNVLVFGQLFYLLNCRYLLTSSFRKDLFTTNPVAWISIGVLIGLQLVFVYAPFMNTWFGSVPVPPAYWVVPVAIGVAVFLIVEAAKAVSRRRAAPLT